MCVPVILYPAVARQYSHNAGATVSRMTVLCVIGQHRLLSPDRHYSSSEEGGNRNVFQENYRREFCRNRRA